MCLHFPPPPSETHPSHTSTASAPVRPLTHWGDDETGRPWSGPRPPAAHRHTIIHRIGEGRGEKQPAPLLTPPGTTTLFARKQQPCNCETRNAVLTIRKKTRTSNCMIVCLIEKRCVCRQVQTNIVAPHFVPEKGKTAHAFYRAAGSDHAAHREGSPGVSGRLAHRENKGYRGKRLCGKREAT